MRTQRGQTLITMYMVVLILSVLGGSFLTRGMTINRHGEIGKLNTDTLYLAQGGLEDGIATFTNAIANFQIDANPTCVSAVGSVYPDTNGDGTCNPNIATQTDVIVSNFCAQSAPCPSSSFPAGSTPRAYSWVKAAEPAERTLFDPDGTRIFVRNYEVVTQASHPTNGTFTTTLHQVVTRRLIYTFQHAVFYHDDLEVLPGPDMTLSGRVHSNHDIYLDAGTGKTLTIDTEYLRTPGNIYNKRKNDGTQMAGDVSIKEKGTSPVEFELMIPGQDSSWAGWTADSQTRWGGTVMTGVHGVTELSVPAVGSTAPNGPNAFYANNAAVKITNGLIQKKSGGSYINVPECDPATAAVNPDCVPLGTVSTTPTNPADPNRFYNNREGKIVKMTNIHVMKLGGYYDANSDGILDPPGTPGNPYTSKLPSNGLLFATRDDVAAGDQPGVRLVNGSVINRAGGLTVVSDAPMYVKGDYNTVSKKPAAVIADALNLLSNGWADSTSYQALSNRVASPSTTFNAAFIAGIKTTTSSNYNGGLENYPRLHENWSSKTLSIRGSFVALWNSQVATGNWVYGGNYYTAPNRSWAYETDFLSGQMPPFTPWAVEAVRGAWWKE